MQQLQSCSPAWLHQSGSRVAAMLRSAEPAASLSPAAAQSAWMKTVLVTPLRLLVFIITGTFLSGRPGKNNQVWCYKSSPCRGIVHWLPGVKAKACSSQMDIHFCCHCPKRQEGLLDLLKACKRSTAPSDHATAHCSLLLLVMENHIGITVEGRLPADGCVRKIFPL